MKNEAITILDWGKVKFFLGEVLRNFTRNAGMQATAIGTVAITIVLLGAFLFVRSTLAGLGTDLLNQIEMSVYFTTDATQAQEDAVRTSLARDPRVAAIDFVSKKEGLAELRDRTHNVIDTSLLTENPLPDKLRVRVTDPSLVPAVAASARKLEGVANVVFPQTVIDRLLQVGNVLRRVGIGVIVVFLLVAGIIISNTIRLTVFARRREIAIMQLVGATNMYIRAPFICEGLLDGFMGSLVAIVVLVAAHAALWPKLMQALPWVQLNATPVNAPMLLGQLLLAGGAIGIIASWISVGRHLRT
ncbi:MAG TPA: permease-like cell division protein FtsX [Candidatus Baltobacteraceae bacterium]|nr:permease-like cell division protein FtsX [Candidatus Baltobacteraceae bacterium]